MSGGRSSRCVDSCRTKKWQIAWSSAFRKKDTNQDRWVLDTPSIKRIPVTPKVSSQPRLTFTAPDPALRSSTSPRYNRLAPIPLYELIPCMWIVKPGPRLLFLPLI